MAFDITNAVLYAAEGNWGEAIRCAICAIPGMDIAGKTSKYLMKGGKIAKTLGKGLNAYTKVRNAYGLYKSAKRVGDGVAYMIDKYLVDGEKPSIQTAQEAADIMLATKGLSDYSRMVSDDLGSLLTTKPKTSQSDTKFGVVEDSMIDNIAYKPKETDLSVDNGAGRNINEYDSFNGGSNTNSAFNEWLNKGSSDNKVYFGIDEDGTPQYTGITKQSKDVRLYQHNRNGKNFSDLDVQYDGLTRNQARAVEQYYIENGPNKLNKINSISSNNKYYKDAKKWAEKYIKEH